MSRDVKYIGMDVHKEAIVIAVLSSTGKLVMESIVETQASSILQFIHGLQHHPHVHCVAAAGGLAPDHSRWISSRCSFFLPVKVLSPVFRGKFIAGLKT